MSCEFECRCIRVNVSVINANSALHYSTQDTGQTRLKFCVIILNVVKLQCPSSEGAR